MKKLFRKATAIAGNIALIGATVGMAAAASYPEPFTSNTAVVVGANAAPSDNIAAASLASDLDANAAGSTSVTVTGGESFDLFDSDKLHFGDNVNTVMDSDLDDDDMTALADGEYDDGDIDVDYNQRVTLGAETLKLIVDNDLNDEEPTVGYHFEDSSSDEAVLTYTLNLEDGGAAIADMDGTDFPLFGKDYFVLEAETGKITLLNSAEKTILTEDETVTIDGHTISIEYVDTSGVKFSVDGEVTDKLTDGESYELDDGYHIVLTENLYVSKDTGLSKAELSLGSGKVVLEDGQEADVNDDTVEGLTATVTDDGTDLTVVSLEWKVDGEEFLTEGTSLTMPVFEEFGLIFNGLDFGDSTEEISVEAGEELTLKMGNFDVVMMYNTSSDQWIGDSDGALKIATTTATSSTQTILLSEDEQFLATKLDSDMPDVEQAYYKVTSLKNDSSGFDLKLEDLTGEDKDLEWADADADDSEKKGDIEITLKAVYEEDDAVSTAHNTSYSDTDYINATDGKALMDFAVVEVEAGGDTLHYDTVVSETGMVIRLPSTAGEAKEIIFFEADEDGDLVTAVTGTETFALETDWDSDDDLFAKVKDGITMVDETADDKTVGYDAGKHATMVMEDSDAHTLEIEYYADEVTADLKLVAGGDTESTSDAGVMTVKDSEVATVAGKNLVVVGGSAINSVAAELLGGAYSEAEFTSMTDVAAGEFLIQSFDRSGKTALLVAGYNAADTEKAVTYLLNNDVDTSVGMKMKGTSATEATVVTA